MSYTQKYSGAIYSWFCAQGSFVVGRLKLGFWGTSVKGKAMALPLVLSLMPPGISFFSLNLRELDLISFLHIKDFRNELQGKEMIKEGTDLGLYERSLFFFSKLVSRQCHPGLGFSGLPSSGERGETKNIKLGAQTLKPDRNRPNFQLCCSPIL